MLYEDFARNLVLAVPFFQRALDEHTAANGEVLPHVFLGEVAAALTDGIASHEVAVAALSFLESAFATGDEKIKELIAVSFLEGFPRLSEPAAHLRALLGPFLHVELSRIENWRSSLK